MSVTPPQNVRAASPPPPPPRKLRRMKWTKGKNIQCAKKLDFGQAPPQTPRKRKLLRVCPGAPRKRAPQTPPRKRKLLRVCPEAPRKRAPQ